MSRRSSTGSRAGRAAAGGRLLHFDAFSGIAGNMVLGALLDLGLSRRQLDADLAGLGVPYTLRVRRVRRGALAARHVEVGVPAAGGGGASGRRGARAGAHGPRARTHGRRVRADGRRVRAHGRRYADVRRQIERARLDPAVRARALAIFEALGRAEARVHGIALDRVHFHEVGAVDALVDVVGAAIGLHRLGVGRVTATPPALGHGSVETSHGRLPLPAPATLELLRGIPTVPAHVAWETVTPTGAAIARSVVDEFRPLPAMTIESIGHGAGEDRPGPMPNVLRAVLGSDGGPAWDRVVAIETNLDDLAPEHFDYLMERLFEAGALDVSIQHVQMKKNRPGFLLRVLARPTERQRLAAVVFGESTAIGVRMSELDRLLLRRAERRVDTPYGRVRVKLVDTGSGRTSVSAEYDDAKRAARRSGAPIREVMRAAEEAARSG